MSSRVIIPPRAAEQPTAPASAHDVPQKVQAAFWSGVFVVGLLTVIWWAIIALGAVQGNPVPGGWRTWLAGTLACVMTGLAVACWLGLGWVIKAAARPWRVDDEIRKRVWAAEDAEREAQQEAAEAAAEDVRTGALDTDRDPTTLNQAQLLHLVAIEVLRRHYVLGKKVTRAAMTEAGLCTQPQWNHVNAALQAIGLKTNKTMRDDLGFETAWEIWQGGVKIQAGRRGPELWVQNRQGQWKFLEELS